MLLRTQLLEIALPYVISSLLASFDEQQIKQFLDNSIDELELWIEKTPNKFDDGLLPVLKFIREVFSIPDN